MRASDIDRSGDVWVYTPRYHKTEHHGKERRIFLGPLAQELLAPWILDAGPDDYLFPTRRAEHYSSDSYRQLIQRTIDRINKQREKEAEESGCEPVLLPRWSPNQLRKAAAQEIRNKADVETSAALMGHSSSVVTQNHYAFADAQRAIQWAKKFG
jgi:integrase